ncbi:hypothetical protein QBC35DRAFT_7570 [Podospora australis]|uniref:Uncharacterized protein n=1 Tax=Podospora australis TaxID=1536484 RepID=A0AAN7AM59_9PEZI|nr:hypothetical protein QBC35DRAFT_7570 [Podospora australis]
MDPSRVRTPSSASSTVLRPITRRPGLAVAGLAIAGAAYGIQHLATAFRENDAAQKRSATFYVSVDRSGGGI